MSSLRARLARTRWSTRIAAAIAAVTGVALCLSPVFGIPGLESALVLGIVLPPLALVIGVRTVIAARAAEGPRTWPELLGQAHKIAFGVVAIPIALLLLDLLRVPACDPLAGLGFLLLGPIAGALLAVSLGVAIGAALPQSRIATWVAGLLPFFAIGLAVIEFYRTPAIFAYGHFSGYFPGTLYDPDVALTATFVSFRAITLAWTLALWAGLSAFWDPEARRLRLGRARSAPGSVLLFTILLSSALTGEALAVDIGHASTSASIAEALGGRLEGRRCTVILPRETVGADARRLVEDCDFRVERAERVLGVAQPRRITAFFFRSADEKRALMGASSTYIAKPWRDEVYLQVGEWPHPVLVHELTHVVAGNVGRGPFRVAGSLGGWLPNPAIIEGVAMAIEWREVDGLTLHQWSRAMLELELMPPLSSVDGLEFMLSPAGRAYVTTGSFVRWMRDTRGAASVRRLYSSGGLEEALGTSLEEAEREWHAYLRTVDLPPEALALARARFERPGIFGQICPHAIANRSRELAADLSAGADARAIETCHAILELDPGQASVRASLASAHARRGELAAARREVAALVGPPSAAGPIVASARLGLADALWTRGRRDDARAIYRELVASPLSEDDVRQIEVRLLALDAGGDREEHLRMLLVPPPERQNDAATIMWAIEGVRGDDGLGDYLAARQLAARQRYDLARAPIERARRAGLPTDRLEREARRLDGIVAYGVSDLDRAEAIFREIERDGAIGEGKRVEARDWLARVAWSRSRAR
ncbi:MAG: hypothetical protein IT378_22610 [Sandaracinaceae bacterium]|nr:hypothetical protein [Sandaracinaceae bacterium]